MIHAPIPGGSGALIVHKQLENRISDYKIRSFDPLWSVIPQTMAQFKDPNRPIVHSSTELIHYLATPEQKAYSTIHNFYFDPGYLKMSGFLRSNYYKHILKPAFLKGIQRSEAVVAVSDFTRDIALRNCDPKYDLQKKIIVIKNGVDCEIFKPTNTSRDGNKVKILFAGNPSSRKGWDVILQLAKELPKGCEILCASNRTKPTQLTHSRITILPRTSHSVMHKVYQQADIFLLPSIREGLSLALLEAMASGLPVVTFDISSMPEAIIQGKGGFLVNPNRPSDLAKAITDLRDNASKRGEFGEFNRSRAERLFCEKRMALEYSSLLT